MFHIGYSKTDEEWKPAKIINKKEENEQDARRCKRQGASSILAVIKLNNKEEEQKTKEEGKVTKSKRIMAGYTGGEGCVSHWSQ